MRIFLNLCVCVALTVIGSCRMQNPERPDAGFSADVPADAGKHDEGGSPGILVASNVFSPRFVRGVDGGAVSVQVPAGFPAWFCWSPAGRAGRRPTRWRAGWDLVDLDGPWEEGTFDGQPICREMPENFFFGSHMLVVESFDADGNVTRFAVRLDVQANVRRASVDIQPRRCPNRLAQMNHGRIRAVLFGRPGFDVRDVLPETVRLGEAPAVSVRIRDVGRPAEDASGCSTKRRDGFEDMVLSFRLEELGGELDTAPPARRVRGEVTLFLWGKAGSPIADDFGGSDAIQVGPRHRFLSCFWPWSVAGRHGSNKNSRHASKRPNWPSGFKPARRR